MPTKTELVLEQTQQGASYEVLITSILQIPFKFFNSWFDQIDFEDIVKEKWPAVSDLEQSKPLHTKLKDLKSHLKLWTPRINRMQELEDLEKLKSMDLDFLESVVSMDEIKAAVWYCGSQKAPRLDGYSFMFIKKLWDLPKYDILSFVVHFFSTDYRPIFVIGIHYKIVAKILANRLSKVIDSIISPEQSAFINGRQIVDGPLILSETIDWYKKRKKKTMLFKVDFEKAFDSGLYMALNDGLAGNMFHGVKVGSPGMHLSHLFYANDVIILSEWNLNAMENIIRIINIFYIASRLKINIHKSNVYGVGGSFNEVEIMASYTGCEAGFFPFTYLGLPIG
ncbi:putative RNA-directed DNA polymerase, eukaryota, reverse transcriptase zinc-binding domain protein [Tanacetum coccineum]